MIRFICVCCGFRWSMARHRCWYREPRSICLECVEVARSGNVDESRTFAEVYWGEYSRASKRFERALYRMAVEMPFGASAAAMGASAARVLGACRLGGAS